ncbi:MAG: metalloregulator ArsR/SmtB family transcription factor [Phycisphaerales bacterium]|nr:winged helix-turn-helix transcriptional regulator [Planctomycetota bacterium]MCH8508120.1 metalloregulator ArsR/SmtB family transcription factor [Phycisphaerales bacterium]
MNPSRPQSPVQAAACCGPIDRLLNPDLFKALCDPTRAGLLACIAKCGRPCSVSEVAACCSVDTSVVSRHLATLEKASVLSSERDGRVVRYAVRYQELSKTLRALADAIDQCCPEGFVPGERGCCEEKGALGCGQASPVASPEHTQP